MNAVISPLLWSFIPSQLSHVFLLHLSNLLPRIFPPAPRGSPLYRRNYRITYSLLVIGYLIWGFVPVHREDDWYALLGVGRSVEDEGLKRAFRTLSRRYHPDRSEGNGDLFILIRQAYEVLTDPTRRYAYDRFGPDMVHWRTCKTVKDFMYTGVTHSIGFYVISGGLMTVLSLLRKVTHGAYWRQTLFAVLLYLELSLILSPTPPLNTIPFVPPALYPILPGSWFDTPQFIWVSVFHRLWTTVSIGITQLAGVWADDELGDEKDAMRRVNGLVRSIEAEAVGQFQSEVVPLLSGSKNPPAMERSLLAEMEHILIDQTLSTHPAIKDSWQLASARRLNAHASHTSPNTHSFSSSTPGSFESRRRQADLDLARHIPLPPSPPPSPRPSPRQLR